MPSQEYSRAVRQVRERLAKYAALLWESLPAYRDADMERFVAQLVPRVLAGQVAIANLTAADLARELGTTPALVDREWVTGGRHAIVGSGEVPPTEVYGRPFTTVHAELAEGAALQAAVAAGRDRLVSLVTTDLQLAKVRQADRSMRSAGVKKFRRVLTGAENCALCAVASTQRYHVGDLLPIHPGCDCEVEPMPDGWDGDRVIDPDLLEQVHQSISDKVGDSDRAGRAVDYRKLLLVREHGEIGNVLTWRHQNFTSAADIPKYKTTRRRR